MLLSALLLLCVSALVSAHKCCPDSFMNDELRICNNTKLEIDLDCSHKRHCFTKHKKNYNSSLSSEEDVVLCDFNFSLFQLYTKHGHVMFYMSLFIANVCFITTLVVYLKLSKTRVFPINCILSYVVVEVIYNLFNLLVLTFKKHHHYFVLTGIVTNRWCIESLLAWLNVAIFDIWRHEMFGAAKQTSVLMKVYCLWAIGVPLLSTIYPFIVNMTEIKYSLRRWLYHSATRTSLNSLLLFVIVNFIFLLWAILKRKRKMKINPQSVRPITYLNFLIVIQQADIVVIFEHLTTYNMLAIKNILHGLIAFIFLVPLRKSVLREIAQNELFGIHWPESWKAFDNDEQHNGLVNEVEMETPKPSET